MSTDTRNIPIKDAGVRTAARILAEIRALQKARGQRRDGDAGGR